MILGSQGEEVVTIDILYLIDQLEVLLSEGWRIPLTTKVVIDEDECLNLIDQLRVNIPAEIKKAKRIQQESQKIVVQGQEEAERIVSLAREQARRLIDEEDLRRQAEETVQEIVDSAMRDAQEIREGANRYAAEVLRELDERLLALQTTVRNGLNALTKQQETLSKQKSAEEKEGSPNP